MKHSLLITLLIILIALAAVGGTLTYFRIPKGSESKTSTALTKPFTAPTTTFSSTITTLTTPSPNKTTAAVTAVSFSFMKRVITTSIKDSIIMYTEWRYYSKLSLTPQTIKALKEKITDEIMGTYSGINITNLSISVYPNNTVKIVFAVTGKVWLSGNEKYADFLWLLTPLGLDFIENHFTETNHGLYWVGTLNNVSTEINVLLPKQATVYRAWGNTVGHCHGHIWWPAKP